MVSDKNKFEWKVTEENLERLGVKRDGGKVSNFLYSFVKSVGDRVSDITYMAAGGRKPDESERQEIAQERRQELEARREAQADRRAKTAQSQKQKQ